jgi:hypothetical protein
MITAPIILTGGGKFPFVDGVPQLYTRAQFEDCCCPAFCDAGNLDEYTVPSGYIIDRFHAGSGCTGSTFTPRLKIEWDSGITMRTTVEGNCAWSNIYSDLPSFTATVSIWDDSTSSWSFYQNYTKPLSRIFIDETGGWLFWIAITGFHNFVRYKRFGPSVTGLYTWYNYLFVTPFGPPYDFYPPGCNSVGSNSVFLDSSVEVT